MKPTGIKHIDIFIENMDEVQQLTEIHLKMAGKGSGYKKDVQILNKSGIVLLTACWESFIEDLASEAFNFVVDKCPSHSKIPNSVLVKASKTLKDSQNGIEIWKLAGEGWRTILKDYGKEVLEKEIDFFHVPRPDKIDDLFVKLIDLKKISSEWKWKGMSNSSAKQKLEDFINLRGSIAHKIKTHKNVWKKDVDEYRKFLYSLVVITHNRTNTHIDKITGKTPWGFGLHGHIR